MPSSPCHSIVVSVPGGLVERVVDFLPVDLADDVER
jgi:hypothetical protein